MKRMKYTPHTSSDTQRQISVLFPVHFGQTSTHIGTMAKIPKSI
jgi:hypothetical protein